jgi:hypothetical protein
MNDSHQLTLFIMSLNYTVNIDFIFSLRILITMDFDDLLSLFNQTPIVSKYDIEIFCT